MEDIHASAVLSNNAWLFPDRVAETNRCYNAIDPYAFTACPGRDISGPIPPLSVCIVSYTPVLRLSTHWQLYSGRQQYIIVTDIK
jgi:hypothetical protein